MANLSKALSDLRAERKRVAGELESLDQAIGVISRLGSGSNAGGRGARKLRAKRRLSPAARRRIAEAQKLRWAKWKAKQQKRSA
jgi:hypothetical protein